MILAQPCAAPAPAYVAAPVPCRPRYIIVRQVEQQVPIPQAPVGYATGPIAAPVGYSAPVPAPVGYSAPVAAPASYATGQVSSPVIQAPIPPVPVEQPIETAPIASAQQGGYRAFASKTVADPKCNSIELRAILENEISTDANESKRRVHKTANEQFQTTDSERGIDVICASGSFSYRIATDIFCEHTKGEITCFAYQQHS